MANPGSDAAFRGLLDLAAESLGGRALYANDEFFAEKENLLKSGRGVFIEGKYTDRGKWMDGWESRRKRVPGHDFCIVRLGVPGVLRGVDIDTNHFLGNHPPYAALDGARAAAEADPLALEWVEILPRSPLRPGSQNLFAIASGETFTHLRLRIYPDGGVARLRLYGEPRPDLGALAGGVVDLAAVVHGARSIGASDMFFGDVAQMLLPGRPENMGGGWETKRRRGPGHDWAIVRLAGRGLLERIEVDTCHFKGNYPDRCSLDACRDPGFDLDVLNWPQAEWRQILPEQKLEADHIHVYERELLDAGPWDYVRLNIYPDGGVARLRCLGRLERS
jgi:allantoicase